MIRPLVTVIVEAQLALHSLSRLIGNVVDIPHDGIDQFIETRLELFCSADARIDA